jgi:hypothetical protein
MDGLVNTDDWWIKQDKVKNNPLILKNIHRAELCGYFPRYIVATSKLVTPITICSYHGKHVFIFFCYLPQSNTIQTYTDLTADG